MPSERYGYAAIRNLRSAFTLIEMLTVIAIIGILAGILIPTVQVALRKVRIATATADIRNLDEALTAYNLDFGAFPPDCTGFMFSTDTKGNLQSDIPYPGSWITQAPLNPNELMMWYLTMRYSTGQYSTVTGSYPASGYPDNYGSPYGSHPVYNSEPNIDTTGWPSSASAVFSHVNSGPYFTMKAKQKTDYNNNGYYEFMDPWGRPYMYRAYPQMAQVTNVNVAAPQAVGSTWTVTLTLATLASPTGGSYYHPNNSPYLFYSGYNFLTGTNLVPITNPSLAYTTGSIQLSGFSLSNYNGTFTFQGSTAGPGTVTLTFTAGNPGTPLPNNGIYGYYTFPLHNQQSCDIYSLGPYGLTRAAGSMPNSSNGPQEWKPTHGGVLTSNVAPPPYPCLDPTSLDAWPQVWGTPGDGNDINSNSGNVIVNSTYQDNISNWQ